MMAWRPSFQTLHSQACVACMLHMFCNVFFWYLPSCLSSKKLFWGLHTFLGICCDQSHRVLFRVPERLVHSGDKWCEICDHHLLPSLSKVHFHPCCSCSLRFRVSMLASCCCSLFNCWGWLGSLCTIGHPVDLGHSWSLSLFLPWLH